VHRGDGRVSPEGWYSVAPVRFGSGRRCTVDTPTPGEPTRMFEWWWFTAERAEGAEVSSSPPRTRRAPTKTLQGLCEHPGTFWPAEHPGVVHPQKAGRVRRIARSRACRPARRRVFTSALRALCGKSTATARSYQPGQAASRNRRQAC